MSAVARDLPVTTTTRQVGDKQYERLLFKTHFITSGEDMVDVVSHYLTGFLKEGDVIFVSDKALANSQNRSIHVNDIKPGFFARLLYRFVYKSIAGRGIGTPEKMQVAIEQVGLFRILLGAFFSLITKIFGIRGVFYKIVGEKVRGIDGMSGGPDGPYWNCVILPSESPSAVARRIYEKTGFHAVIADINYVDGHIMGLSSEQLDELDFLAILKDNPMGQENAQTPIGIIRLKENDARNAQEGEQK